MDREPDDSSRFPKCQHKQQVTGRNLEGNMSLMGSKAREFCSEIPVYQKIRAQYINITSKSTNERSNTTAEKIDTKKNSPKFTKTSNRGRNQDVSKPTICIPSPQYILNKEKGNDEQETIKENKTSEYAKLHHKTARNYQPPETQQIKKNFIQRGNSDIDTPSQQAPQNRTKNVCPGASSTETRV